MRRNVIILAMLIGIIFTFAFAGCSSKKEASTDNKPTQAAENQGSTTKDNENSISGLEALLSGKTDPDNFSFEYVITDGENSQATMKVYVKGKKEKIEIGQDDQAITTYVDYEKGESYTYMKELGSAIKGDAGSNTGFQSPATFMSSFDKEQLKLYKKIGSETIDGNKCTKYEYKLTDKNEDFYIYILDDSGLIIKYDYLENGKLASSVYFKNFKIGQVTDEMVTLPKDIPVTAGN